MFNNAKHKSSTWGLPLGTILACSILFATSLAQSVQGNGSTAAPSAAHPTPASSPYHPAVPARARDYYQLVWGVEDLTVRAVESGELIRFNYRVVDAAKAQPLNDKKSEPQLFDERARVQLVVPSLEKVGQLRQSSTPEAGKVYWMAFSNKGGLVKRGDRVTVVIGKFRADGLVVE
jgi:hypothetical protein